MKASTIWRYNPITGFWRIERMCLPENVDQWLDIFKKDEPTAFFEISRFSPKYNPTLPHNSKV